MTLTPTQIRMKEYNSRLDVILKKKIWQDNNKNYTKNYYMKNKEKINEKNKAWRNNNKELKKQIDLNYTKKNKEKIKFYKKEYTEKNREEINRKKRLYYANNKHLIREQRILNGIITGNGQSKYEKQIEQFLIENNIKYECEFTFVDCINNKGNELPFDFYLVDYNLLIEYDGEHHFRKIWDNFEVIQLHDKIKNEYCKNNKINLLRIHFKANLQEELETLIKNVKTYKS